MGMLRAEARQRLRAAKKLWILCSVAVASTASMAMAEAADVAASAPAAPLEAPAAASSDQPSISSSIPQLGAFKTMLLDRGFNLQVNYIGEVFGNPTGGVRQGALYEQRIELGLDADMEKIAGVKGLTFHVNSYAIAGSSLSTYNLFNYSAISYIAAHPAFLIFELWVEQNFFDGRLAVRAGQLAADCEFFISELAQLSLNSTFGWPNIFATDFPSGGPAYPYATPAVRVKFKATDQLTLLGAVFNGDPTGAGITGRPAEFDHFGANFRLRDVPFLIGEAQYAYNQDKDSDGLAGKVKFGGWYQFGRLDDERFGTDGLSLADPRSNGQAMKRTGDFGVYGAIDQMFWRLPGDDPKAGIGGFARVTGSPSDRNLMDFYADAGVDFIGLWSQRPCDLFGVSVAYSELSPSVHALDLDAAAYAGTPLASRNYELLLEATYQAQIVPGWTVQPDFEYVFHPGGGAVNPLNPMSGRIPDAAVFGVRTTVQF